MKYLYLKVSTAHNILLIHLVLKMNCSEETLLVMYDRQLKGMLFNIVEPLFSITQFKVSTHLTIYSNDPN